VFDPERANTVFTNRIKPCLVNEEFSLQVPLPLSGRVAIVRVHDELSGNSGKEDGSFKVVSVKKFGLRQFLGALNMYDQNLRNFIDFAQRFCFNAGTLNANTGNETYCSRDPEKTFRLKYLPILINPNSGTEDITPARVDKYTHVFEASKKKMSEYTVPMRFCIMTHEFGHQINPDPADEKQADLTGLKIYLALGYSRIEAIETYATTFEMAPSDDNVYNRFTAVQQYIDRFYEDFYFKKQII
jgi:hypothetical protein